MKPFAIGALSFLFSILITLFFKFAKRLKRTEETKEILDLMNADYITANQARQIFHSSRNEGKTEALRRFKAGFAKGGVVENAKPYIVGHSYCGMGQIVEKIINGELTSDPWPGSKVLVEYTTTEGARIVEEFDCKPATIELDHTTYGRPIPVSVNETCPRCHTPNGDDVYCPHSEKEPPARSMAEPGSTVEQKPTVEPAPETPTPIVAPSDGKAADSLLDTVAKGYGPPWE